jgi:hypothetical protein
MTDSRDSDPTNHDKQLVTAVCARLRKPRATESACTFANEAHPVCQRERKALAKWQRRAPKRETKKAARLWLRQWQQKCATSVPTCVTSAAVKCHSCVREDSGVSICPGAVLIPKSCRVGIARERRLTYEQQRCVV